VKLREPSGKELAKLRAVADYQFEMGVGEHLFPPTIKVMSSRGRIRQVWIGDEPLCAVRASDGFIVLNRKGAEILHKVLPARRLRVVVTEEVARAVRRGRTVFAKHVVEADPEIRPAEEVLVVDVNGNLLASGTAVLSGEEMKAFKEGKAVKVRRGQKDVS